MANQSIRQIELMSVDVTFADNTQQVFYNVAEITVKDDTLRLLWLEHGINDIVITEYKSYETRYQGEALVAGDE